MRTSPSGTDIHSVFMRGLILPSLTVTSSLIVSRIWLVGRTWKRNERNWNRPNPIVLPRRAARREHPVADDLRPMTMTCGRGTSHEKTGCGDAGTGARKKE